MGSLELSLFMPDFTITSFYKVFGSDPTGLGCLFIKDSVLGCLQNKGNTGTGMVSIIHVSPQYLSDSGEWRDGTVQESDGTTEIGEDGYGSEFSIRSHLPAFSGAFSSAQVRDVFKSEIEYMRTILTGMELVQFNFKKSPPSNLGLRQLHNGFSQRTKHKKSSTETISKSSTEDYGNGPTYDEEKKSLGVNNEIVAFDAAISSVSQDITQTKLVSDAQTSCLKGNTKPLQDDIKKATSKKSREIDTRESVYNSQGKSHADQDPSYEIDDNRDKGGNHTSEQSMGIAEEVVQSVSSEISSCDKDDKQFMERPIHAKQNIVNATTSLANGPREPERFVFQLKASKIQQRMDA
ncbi:hypothetical protein SUGI_0804600 [Cryptomeria japonica]|nr:hypothetical protein SUGI_0804600 [Cryptomeria japonica]